MFSVVLVTQSCPTICNPMDYSLPCSVVHGIIQERVLEWVSMPFSKRSSGSEGTERWSSVFQEDSLLYKSAGKP